MDRISRFRRIPDPRSRRRRQYPLHGLLAILVLAAAHQENSLRGMGQWAKERAEILLNFPPLDLWSNHDFPSYGTFWYLLTKLGVGELEQALRGWGRREERLALDGKVLRGSKRADWSAGLEPVAHPGRPLYPGCLSPPGGSYLGFPLICLDY